MDEKDKAIIRILERRSGLSSRALAKIVRLPISTTHRRIKMLEEKGVITGYKAIVNYEKTDRPVAALLLVDLAEVIPGKGHIPKKDVLNSLKRFSEIEQITEVQASEFDLLAKARLRTIRELSKLIEDLRSLEGIEEISSAIVSDEIFIPPPILFNAK